MKNVNLFLYNALYFRVADGSARKNLSDDLTVKLSECEPGERKAVLLECKANIKAGFKLDGFKIYLTVLNVLAILAAVLLPIEFHTIVLKDLSDNLNWLAYLLTYTLWCSSIVLVPIFVVSYIVGLIIKRVEIKHTVYNLVLCALSIVMLYFGWYYIFYTFAELMKTFNQ